MKKHLKRALLLVVVLAVTLAVGVAVVLYNPGLIKGPLERYLSDVAGYPISLKGKLEIDTGKLSTLTAEHIQISGPDWAGHDDLIAVSHLRLSVLTSSLFEKIIVIDSLQVDDLQLNLETDAKGKGNWISANKSNTPSSAKEDDSDTRGSFIVFSNIEVSDSTLRFQNGKTDVDYVFNISSLSHQQQSDGILHTVLSGDLNNRPVEYTGSIGPYVNLLNGRDVSYTVSGQFGELIIDSKGQIYDLLKPRQPKFTLNIQGPDIDEITDMLGIDDLGSGGFNLRANGAKVNGAYAADISGQVGDISLSASVEADDPTQINEIDIKAAINGPSLGAFTRTFGIEHFPDKPFNLKGAAERVGGTLNIRDLTLNIGGTQLVLDALLTKFPELDASRVKLSVTGDEVAQFRELLGISGIATGPFSINGKLDVSPKGLELVLVEVETSLGQATLTGTLGSAPTYTGSKFQLHLDGNNARSLVALFDIDALPEQPFNLNTQLEIMENGIRIEHGVLVTIEDERLELGGFIAFNPGIKGTDITLRVRGEDLAEILNRLVETEGIPDRPYDLSGRVQILDDGLQLENIEAEFEGIKLSGGGLINLADQLLGSSLDFQLAGDDLSSLSNFEVIGDSLDIFVPGLPYQANGRFNIADTGLQFDGVTGRLGETDLNFDLLISQQADMAGSNVRFSIKGPGLNELLVDNEKFSLPPGTFESSGHVSLSNDSLSIKDLNFANERAHGQFDLEFGWPFDSASDMSFDVRVGGDDINRFLPKTDWFEAETLAFQADASGNIQNDLISLQKLEAEVGNLRFSTKGQFGASQDKESADISFEIFSDDISKLGRLKGERLEALKLDIKGSFKGDARQFNVRNLNGILGESRMNANIDVSLKGPKPVIKLIATSDLIDIRPFQRPDEPDDESTTPEKKDRLIPATPLPLEALAAADVLIKINIGELRHLEDSIRNVVIDTEIKAGGLNVPQISFEAPMGDLKTSFSITPTQAGQADVKINLDAEELVLNTSGVPREKVSQIPSLNLDFKISGTGGNYQEVAGSLNGAFYLETDGGTLEGVNLSVLDTFVLDEIFSAMMPKSDRADDLALLCGATILNITDGLIETNPGLAFTTDQIAIIAKGNLNLKTEKMHFNFNATPTNALKISASELFNPYILVSGTMSKPVVGVDPAKALLHGGAAIGTAGISILAKGLIDRVSNAVPLCEEMQKTVRMEKSARGKKGKRRK